ncbi:helix-turn-helix transcriptional regulator [Aureimonas ureilytica]|uniref:helix-turn-helix transcriptional regulator n=1 Tax=Aureimonas ureilytica TaxID=401562 RepID=UPI0009DC42E0|nr:helix-turn-helix transcriptional regulator [Aureimonas ureilytica]
MREIARECLPGHKQPSRTFRVAYAGSGDPISKGHAPLCHQYGDDTMECHRFGGSQTLQIGDRFGPHDKGQKLVTKGKSPNGVRRALDASGISQAELARLTGESRQQIGRIVNEERKLALPMATKIAMALSCDVRDLFLPDQLVTPAEATANEEADLSVRKARILDEIRGLSFERQAEVLSEALATIARGARGEPETER